MVVTGEAPPALDMAAGVGWASLSQLSYLAVLGVPREISLLLKGNENIENKVSKVI